jgi:hypothetical protein
MRRTRRRGGRGYDPSQLQIEWSRITGGGPVVTTSPPPFSGSASNDASSAGTAPQPSVLCLLWDFQTTFPQPTSEAIDAGVISEDDADPENVRSIHEEHAREALAVLRELDVVLDACRRGVDPRNNKAPMLEQAKERLQKFFETEPARLERWWETLMDTYEEVFGPEAADAFSKALRARQAGIPVTAEQPRAVTPTPAAAKEETPARPRIPKQARRQESRRIVARLPVPKPLPSAIAAGHFGQEEDGKPLRPGAHEVREITEQHAEKLIDLLDSLASAPATGKDALQAQFGTGIAAYAEDFGQHAADQLEAYVKRQASLDVCDRADRGSRH